MLLAILIFFNILHWDINLLYVDSIKEIEKKEKKADVTEAEVQRVSNNFDMH